MKHLKKVILFFIPKLIKIRIKTKTFYHESVPICIEISNGSNEWFENNEILNQQNVYLNITSNTPGLHINEIKELIRKNTTGICKICIRSRNVKNLESGFIYILTNEKGETITKKGIPGAIDPYSNTYIAKTNSKEIILNKNAHFILNHIEPQSKITIDFYEGNDRVFTKFEKFVIWLSK
jgi:hypothetical protein